MSFSLRAIFAVMILAVLAAAVYQEKLKTRKLTLEFRTATDVVARLPDDLEERLPFLRAAVNQERHVESLHEQVVAKFEAVQKQYETTIKKLPEKVSILNIPRLNTADGRFVIHVPSSLNAHLEFLVCLRPDFLNQDLSNHEPTGMPSVKEAVSVELPIGISIVTFEKKLKKKVTPTGDGVHKTVRHTMHIELTLNGDVVLEAELNLNDERMIKSMIWDSEQQQQDVSSEDTCLNFAYLETSDPRAKESRNAAKPTLGILVTPSLDINSEVGGEE